MSITVKYTKATITYSIEDGSMIMTDTLGKRMVIPDAATFSSGDDEYFYESHTKMLKRSDVKDDVGFEVFASLIVEGLLNNEKLRVLLDGSRYEGEALIFCEW